MARDLQVPSVDGIECVEDWALAGVCADPDPLGCVDTTRLLHRQDGQWADVGFSLQTCIEELTRQGVPEQVAARFDGFFYCFTSTQPTATPPPNAQASCGDIGFEAQSDDIATDIAATGVDCTAASELVRLVSEVHNFYSGPSSFEAGGYSCSATLFDEGLPYAEYSCTNSTSSVSWTKS